MQASDVVPILERMREQLVDFHEAVARAHERALTRTLEQASRQLRWLTALAHETVEDAWHGRLSALQELASGLPAAALESGALTPAALAREALTYWQGTSFREAATDLLTRRASRPEDLQALAQALALFFEELAGAVESDDPGPASEAGETEGEAR